MRPPRREGPRTDELEKKARAKHFGLDRWLGPGFEAACTSLDGPLCAA